MPSNPSPQTPAVWWQHILAALSALLFDNSPVPAQRFAGNAIRVCVFVLLFVACTPDHQNRRVSPPVRPQSVTKDVQAIRGTVTEEAPKAIQEAAKAIREETAGMRADLQKVEVEAPIVAGVPEWLKLPPRLDRIDAAAGKQDETAELLRNFGGKFDELNANVLKWQAYGDEQGKRAEAAVKAAERWEKEAADQKARADDAFKRRLEGWAVFATLGAVGCLILAGFSVFKGNIKGALGLGTVAGILITGAVLLFVIASWWKWIVGGVLITFAAFIGWLIYSRLEGDKLKTTLQTIVPVIEAEDPNGTGIKVRIGEAAAKAGASVKSTVKRVVGSVKEATNQPERA